VTAQGITGGSVQGIVTSAAGAAVEEATVGVTNLATGERWQALTRSGGRYTLEHLAVGGPYRLEVRALGFAPVERAGLSISQGQRLWQEFRLTAVAVTLDELTVRARDDPELNAGRTGPSLTLTDSAIARLPLDIRDFSRLAVLSPLVTPSADGGLSFAGEHSLLNSILVDGTTASSLRGGGNDGFGGIPGNQSEFGYFDIVPEAVQEIQIMTAPYDVRYGNFAGGLISAVTKSGTNRWHGSVYGYLNSPSLAGHNPDHTRLDPFTRQELGVTLGGQPQSLSAHHARSRPGYHRRGLGDRARLWQRGSFPADPGGQLRRGCRQLRRDRSPSLDRPGVRENHRTTRREQPARAVAKLSPREPAAGGRARPRVYRARVSGCLRS
jgi:hypothetical protein